ncbi:asparagine synthase (glutamine-hydrolyzing) [Deinococcus metallilatus]|uniref:asparagine synthase (glutamine-hydrolyzing) n=1 Tax=Deinococcus metallilatus TaxID=1211322 RepID=A0ABR6MXY5_9DEIO|nr:asparagine synthase (glutamine-hydrolyzing) [Deinococcus metallilatus]MBB5296806.1 asparagine synthase (glutamine-hydrolyzing) [Deinococcus metallilatus]GMA13838.1 asparagine synthetase B [Deinococcus metallilatus]
MRRRPAPTEALGLDTLCHRGPDAQTSAWVGGAHLGHARLSIIDLTSGGQPMSDVHGLTTIVFNGEIYNHLELRRELEARGQVFATRSDTEVILAAYLAWGVAGFARLRGMFAFALHDRRDGNTVIARDPFGIKPLFWTRGRDGSVYFASEVGALLELSGVPTDLDLSSVLETLTSRHPSGLNTLYEHVKRVEPGTALVVAPQADAVIHVRFGSVAEEVERRRLEGVGNVTPGEVRERVLDSVEHHTLADVPLGCFLSGGLDSSVVAQALASRGGEPLNAYAVGFEGASSEASELPYARLVADALGVRLHPVTLGAADFAALAPRLSGSLNGPFSEPADIAMLKLSLRAAQDVKVVLSGEGGDEAFGGYPKYAVDGFARPLGPAMRLGHRWLGRRGRLGIAADALSEPDRAARWMRWFANDDAPRALVGALVGAGARPERALGWVEDRLSAYPPGWSDLQRMQVLDLEAWLPNNLLHRGDYTTMQASIEQRVPLLDLCLTPWAVALPGRVKIQRLRGKMPLRQAFGDRLPKAVLERPKSGFRLPLGEWMTSDPALRSMTRDLLLSSGARLRAWLSPGELEALLAPAALAQTGGAKLAWTAVCLELWLQAVQARVAA